MANAVTLRVKAAASSVDPLQHALREFQDTLNPENLSRLRLVNAKPDAAAVISFTAQLDDANAQRRSRCVASRLFTILESVQQFSGIVETFVSSNPSIAALVWGSVKLSILVGVIGRI